MPRWKVCSHKDCTNLVSPAEPCPTHARPRNAPWSKDRDREAQRAFRMKVLNRDGNRCTRCGATEKLVAHHLKPGYEASAGITLCEDCHREVDRHAR